ncbi:hypothetical protein MBM_08022 [Drepanopeziza brunnea f. sp. 'multigermtubi' MB_m1]|uniref:Ima1 N-terminal domain-containing protein n=1 Tax=Marssonina brunnea f. sp. multigermtubi (strain MB_m1) TaxID=1072389 RepID=K1WLR1_MARBU|nr:uncharacterized protein MBM_08022 [Drepanopeziza brunnea f. sp. 'multigermtubi' MB_m1]EKD13821.1 hypothetical protein MBM_08022 [Drepanopeziza brunnea f. sp. 'multigermtubi' MB_m1]
MARLVCFYCSNTSNIYYDGSIRKWDCVRCDATNFLDENGEITDPVVATEIAPANLIYSTTRPPNTGSESESQSTLFCATCLKNQHLYTASIAQYDFDTNTSRRGYMQEERAYFKWKRSLEKRYPQVCKDCEPQVLERMRRAGKTAKTDHLRRLMEKSRARRAAPPEGITNTRIVIFIGRLLWYFGILGQLIWNITAMVSAAHYEKITGFLTTTPGSFPVWIKALLGFINSDTWAWRSLQCTYASIWWCPRAKELERGFTKHITGFRQWYKIQLSLVISRSIFYYIMGSGVFADPFSRATLGAHAAMFVMTTMIFVVAHRAIKVDMSPLWVSIPENIPFVGSGSGNNSPMSNSPDNNGSNSSRVGGTMEDILDEIMKPNRGPLNTSQINAGMTGSSQGLESQAYQRTPYQRPNTTRNTGHNLPDIGRQPNRPSYTPQRITQRFDSPFTPPGQVIAGLTKHRPLLSDMTDQEGSHWLSTSELPARFQDQYGKDRQTDSCTEEMEWQPTLPQKSTHRAFAPSRPLQHESLQDNSQRFGATPAGDQSSPFWFKVPAAPLTPAQRLRNPPNQPRMRVSPAEVKDNFFGTRREPVVKSSDYSSDFAQQRLFFQEKPSEGDALAGMLDSFSLGEERSSVTKSGTKQTSYFVLSLGIAAGCLLAWFCC